MTSKISDCIKYYSLVMTSTISGCIKRYPSHQWRQQYRAVSSTTLWSWRQNIGLHQALSLSPVAASARAATLREVWHLKRVPLAPRDALGGRLGLVEVLDLHVVQGGVHDEALVVVLWVVHELRAREALVVGARLAVAAEGTSGT